MSLADARRAKADRCSGAAPALGLSRRMLLNRMGMGLGGLALADLLTPVRMLTRMEASAGSTDQAARDRGVLNGELHVPAKAKRVIYLFMAGGPSQMETFDYKPMLNQRNGEQLPDSVRQGQRLTGMSGNQSSLPLAGSLFGFKQYGASGAWVSDLLPQTARIVDDLCIVRSMVTEAINHDPAITFFQTGSQIAGRPSLGAWVHYGLGSDTEDLPAFVVLITPGKVDQPLYSRLWGSGFLPSRHQGVQFRSRGDAVLYLPNPDGVSRESRRMLLDRLNELHEYEAARAGDGDVDARIAQYEMAYRLQASVPGVMDLANESDETLSLYGPDARTPGTFAANCLLARRLAERGVKFIQLYHQGWDQHDNLPKGIERQCRETDQASAALVMDLKRRGMLDDTLVVWGGEFGRTSYSQGKLTDTNYGRDHHPRCFTVWMAGGGVKGGLTYGTTDDFAYNVTESPVHVHDFHATLLHLLGIDHERLTYFHQGRRFRLTDVHGQVVRALLA
jgi:hypothetical protein